jgi:hypothetical protein
MKVGGAVIGEYLWIVIIFYFIIKVTDYLVNSYYAVEISTE